MLLVRIERSAGRAVGWHEAHRPVLSRCGYQRAVEAVGAGVVELARRWSDRPAATRRRLRSGPVAAVLLAHVAERIVRLPACRTC